MSNVLVKLEVTSLERVALALQFKKADRVPAAPLFCGASHRVLGITYDKWSTDSELAVKSLLASQKLIGFDAFVTLVDLSVEAADFGQEVIFPKNSTAYPNFNNQYIKTADEYDKIKKINPRETKRMKSVIDICSGLAKAKGNEVAILGFLYGPLGVLSQIRGHKELFKDLIRHPKEVLQAIEIITEVLIEYAVAQIEAGAHSVCIDPLYSSPTVLSKSGNGVYFEEVIKWINPVAISVAHPAYGCKSWEEHEQKWGKKIVTIGYSHPSNTGLIWSEDEIIEDCRKQIELFKNNDSGFILSTGCEFPPNGNLISAAAMVKAAKIYGAYNV